MKCVVCNRGEMVEDSGRGPLNVTEVSLWPATCPSSCATPYLNVDVVKQLDVLTRQRLDGPVDRTVGHYDQSASGVDTRVLETAND